MVTPTKDLAALRPRFSTVVTTLGGWFCALRRSPVHHADPALGAEQAMIRPSPHERVAIEAHREDRL
jgi:hypothetical protein